MTVYRIERPSPWEANPMKNERIDRELNAMIAKRAGFALEEMVVSIAESGLVGLRASQRTLAQVDEADACDCPECQKVA